MFRRSKARRHGGTKGRRLRVIAPLALLVACAGAGADELEAYLQKQGLTQLLAAHLETKLDEVQGDERNELILRLADLYARLLENATGDEREFLEKQSRQLLTEAPPAGANELRLALLRGTYRTAERIAERWRMRLFQMPTFRRLTYLPQKMWEHRAWPRRFSNRLP